MKNFLCLLVTFLLITTSLLFLSCCAPVQGITSSDNENTGGAPSYPFANISDDIVENILLTLGEKSYVFSEEEKSSCIDLLKSVVIYERSDAYKEMDGGLGDVIQIHYSDRDEVTEVDYRYPFIIIDGQGYRCEHEQPGAISNFTSELLFRELWVGKPNLLSALP